MSLDALGAPSQLDGSTEDPQLMFWLRNKKMRKRKLNFN